MSVIPIKAVDKLGFYERHIDPWQTQAAGIGLLPLDVTDLDTKTQAARAAFEAQQSAQDAAQAATLAWHNAEAIMAQAGSDCLKKIRAKAGSAGLNVYVLAEIPAPAIPSPTPAPAKPTELKVSLEESGALKLKWKCPNPARTTGTIYQICRRIGAAAEFEYIGGTGSKSFVDSTLPAGSAQVTYQIQAVRTTAAGPVAQFNVNFGVGGAGGTATAMVSESAPTKLAA